MTQETTPEDGAADIPAQILEAVEAWRKAATDNAVQVEVNGEFRPIGDLNWVLKKSCGCAKAIMYATAMDRTFYDVESAWHELYSSDPHPHKRVRDREIKRMHAEGYVVVLMDRHEAVDLHLKGCVIHRRREDPPEKRGGRRGKFTVEQVIALRRRYNEGGVTFEGLAQEHGVSRGSMASILYGDSYSSVGDPADFVVRSPRGGHTCPRGHAFTEENTAWHKRPDGRRSRECRTCRTMREN